MKSISIIGGGIAGLSLGIALRRHEVPVTVREAGHYPRHRVCGEFICGVSDETLESLGIADALHGCALNRSTGWYRSDRRFFRQDLPVPARGLSRLRLDCRLADRFEEAGGTLQTGDRVSHRHPAVPPEGTVYAAGKTSGESEWLGLKIHLNACPGMDEDLQMHLGDRAYAGISRIEENRFNLCGLFRRRPGIRERGAALLTAYLEASRLTALAERVRSGNPVEESFTAVSGFSFSSRLRRRTGCLNLGDAAGMIPPFTGNGMSLAMQSAEVALPHLLAYARGEIDWTAARRHSGTAARRRFRTRLAAAGLTHALLLGKRRQSLILASVASGFVPFRTLFRLTH